MYKYLVTKFGRSGYNLLIVLAMFVLSMVIGVLFYHYVEGLRPVDAVYFTAMTLTTVGYGDFSPQTDLGKMFTTVYAVLGVAIFLGLATSFFGLTIARLRHAGGRHESK